VYVPTQEGVVPYSPDGKRRFESGDEQYTVTTNRTPAADDGAVFVLGESDNVPIARYDDTGAGLERQWQRRLGGLLENSADPPVYHEGVVYCSESDGLVALSAAGGELLWSNGTTCVEIAVTDAAIYGIETFATGATLVAFDPETGERLWQSRIGSYSDQAWDYTDSFRVSVADGTVYVHATTADNIGADVGRVYGFDHGGEKRWQLTANYPGSSLVPVEEGTAVRHTLGTNSGDDRLRVFDGERADVSGRETTMGEVRAVADAKLTLADTPSTGSVQSPARPTRISPTASKR
jgi:outer membrane protein assembly factor BamB